MTKSETMSKRKTGWDNQSTWNLWVSRQQRKKNTSWSNLSPALATRFQQKWRKRRLGEKQSATWVSSSSTSHSSTPLSFSTHTVGWNHHQLDLTAIAKIRKSNWNHRIHPLEMRSQEIARKSAYSRLWIIKTVSNLLIRKTLNQMPVNQVKGVQLIKASEKSLTKLLYKILKSRG